MQTNCLSCSVKLRSQAGRYTYSFTDLINLCRLCIHPQVYIYNDHFLITNSFCRYIKNICKLSLVCVDSVRPGRRSQEGSAKCVHWRKQHVSIQQLRLNSDSLYTVNAGSEIQVVEKIRTQGWVDLQRRHVEILAECQSKYVEVFSTIAKYSQHLSEDFSLADILRVNQNHSIYTAKLLGRLRRH